MTQNQLENQISNLTKSLVKLVNVTCWNTISTNYMYIISEIPINSGNHDFYSDLKKRRQENSLKTPRSLQEICQDLLLIYTDIYDLNLYVYQSKKSETIIEIRYFPKSSLKLEFLKTVEKREPMLHAKVNLPVYLKSKTDKFDVNWEFGGLRYEWNMFWYKLKVKSKL